MPKPPAPPTPRLDDLRPMLLDDRKYLPFSDPHWVFEIKHDGYRCLAQFGAGAVELRTRRGLDCTKWFPEVAAALATVTAGPHIVDGEVCVLDEFGRSDFDRLQVRARRKKAYPGCDPVVYCVFDLLVEQGRSAMELPLVERKARLKALLSTSPGASVMVLDAIPEHGLELFAMVRELQLEGLVAKRADSVYEPGVRTAAWRKLKRKGAVPPERFKTRSA